MSEDKDILTIPNILTLLRLASLPLVIALFRMEHHAWAACVFLVFMLSDGLDGWLARRLDQCSALGLYLDPVVDKIVILVLFYELARAEVAEVNLHHVEFVGIGVRLHPCDPADAKVNFCKLANRNRLRHRFTPSLLFRQDNRMNSIIYN